MTNKQIHKTSRGDITGGMSLCTALQGVQKSNPLFWDENEAEMGEFRLDIEFAFKLIKKYNL